LDTLPDPVRRRRGAIAGKQGRARRSSCQRSWESRTRRCHRYECHKRIQALKPTEVVTVQGILTACVPARPLWSSFLVAGTGDASLGRRCVRCLLPSTAATAGLFFGSGPRREGRHAGTSSVQVRRELLSTTTSSSPTDAPTPLIAQAMRSIGRGQRPEFEPRHRHQVRRSRREGQPPTRRRVARQEEQGRPPTRMRASRAGESGRPHP
jgi:hypothetical protein